MKKNPNEGGCWFCHNDAGEMFFSYEFDCYFHKQCLQKALNKAEWNPEAEIIANEIGMDYTSKEPIFPESEASNDD